MDPHTVQRRKASTHKVYQNAVQTFLDWCAAHDVAFNSAEELDDLLVEWKQTLHSKALYASAVCGVEMALPMMKG